ncbi:twin-arginine translocase TatA/TatE family subunit [Sphingomonas aerophila]|jgi:sec-independent protein translocase protein TatA|uniref:Sec-independent protein translocase protein TatA n=1 Tax=Sphingomonas aerophila TaxID=1344948 RepID=A0A7W9EWJ7_9SPHN|nr:twin-arginine translocase TatA/TatE family subunit [Sphingomonas aerophila]MBB5715792.1 sec-independent protein translocase protein TatA [Sphingomonas aerophila]
MGGFSPIHLLVLAVVAILLLGGGRFSNLMGDVAKGVKNFKKGMAEEEENSSKPSARIESQKAAEPAFDRDGNRVRDGLRDDA